MNDDVQQLIDAARTKKEILTTSYRKTAEKSGYVVGIHEEGLREQDIELERLRLSVQSIET